MNPLKQGDKCRVRLHNGKVVEAAYDEPFCIEKDHWVQVNGKLCKATNHLADEGIPKVRFVGPSCVLVPTKGSKQNGRLQ